MNTTTPSAWAQIVFRMDDVQDSYTSYAQSRLMDIFIGKEIPLHIAVIGDSIGDDPQVVEKARLGIERGLFETGLHGFHHIDHSLLDEQNQTQAMAEGSQRIQDVFGIKPTIFVSPFGTFNDATLDAMSHNNMSILSSTIARDNGSLLLHDNGKGIDHLSATTAYRILIPGNIQDKTPEQIKTEIDELVKKYGYAILVFHPQDFVQTDENGKAVRMQTASGKMDIVLHDDLKAFASLVEDIVTEYKPLKMRELDDAV